MWFRFLIIFFSAIFLSEQQKTCTSVGILCVTETEYQFCTIINGQFATISAPASCSSGEICNEEGPFPCKEAPTTPPSTSTTPSPTSPTTLATTPVTPPVCTDASAYPAPQCNQYYQCVAVMWWWDYTLQTCPTGQEFNEATSQCEASSTCV